MREHPKADGFTLKILAFSKVYETLMPHFVLGRGGGTKRLKRFDWKNAIKNECRWQPIFECRHDWNFFGKLKCHQNFHLATFRQNKCCHIFLAGEHISRSTIQRVSAATKFDLAKTLYIITLSSKALSSHKVITEIIISLWLHNKGQCSQIVGWFTVTSHLCWKYANVVETNEALWSVVYFELFSVSPFYSVGSRSTSTTDQETYPSRASLSSREQHAFRRPWAAACGDREDIQTVCRFLTALFRKCSHAYH